ncbi:MAG: hypothetical protein ABJA02_08185 [Acidobacteriota bacterium]
MSYSSHVVSPELRTRFLRFREVYVATEERLTEEDAQAAVIARTVWIEAMAAVPLTRDELKVYKFLTAMHSVNGGELFGND